MKIEIHFEEIHEIHEVQDAAEALSKLKAETVSRAPQMLRGIIRSLSDLQFAQEAVKRANIANGRRDALPQSAQDFLEWATERGYATVLEA